MTDQVATDSDSVRNAVTSGDYLYHPYPTPTNVNGGPVAVSTEYDSGETPTVQGPTVTAPEYAVSLKETATLGGRVYVTPSGIGHGIPLRSMRKLTRNVTPDDPAYAEGSELAGGSGLPHTSSMIPVPAWSQLINDYPNKREHPNRDVYATTDCGSQCTAMAIYSVRGVELPEGIVRDYISDCVGGLDQGLTTANDLVAYMRSPHVNFRNARAVQQAWPQVQQTLQEELAARRIVLILGNWYVGTLHWEIARWYDVFKGLKTNNPWNGGVDGVTWQDFANRVNTGVLVLTGEVARYG